MTLLQKHVAETLYEKKKFKDFREGYMPDCMKAASAFNQVMHSEEQGITRAESHSLIRVFSS
jgi:hypothetical protein